jgi:hypothetical protein
LIQEIFDGYGTIGTCGMEMNSRGPGLVAEVGDHGRLHGHKEIRRESKY